MMKAKREAKAAQEKEIGFTAMIEQ